MIQLLGAGQGHNLRANGIISFLPLILRLRGSVMLSAPRYLNISTEVGAREIRYTNDGSGPAVILIHGLGSSLDWWDLTIQALAKHFSVYALDFPGFGGSQALNERVSTEFPALFMAQFMKSLGISKASLVGHSMGGYIAARTALGFPDMVDKLVLVASAGFGRIHHTILMALSLPLVGEILASPTLVGIRVFIRSLVYDKTFASEDRINTAFGYFRRPGAKQDFLRALRTGATFASAKATRLTPDDIRKIVVPTMLIWGAQDPVFPLSQAEVANRLLPHSQMHVFDGCGHIPPIERAAEFNGLMSQFLHSSD